ncbi:MAG: extracellular solute-binding protein [Clostridium sp.]|jgi:maltose-binding protein MalE|nr:extracellular solute-binding protein [Clostridium sp.]
MKAKIWMSMLVLILLIGIYYVAYHMPTYAKPAAESSEREGNDQLPQPGILDSIDYNQVLYISYSDERLTEFINMAAAEFGETHDIRIIPQLMAGGDQLEEINQATLHTTEIPDLYLINHDSLEKATLAGLADVISDPQKAVNTSNFSQTALNAVSYQGKVMAYPLYIETSVLLYNQSYLNEWAMQQALTEAAQSDDAEEGSQEAMEVDEAAVAARAREIFAQAIPETVDELLTIADTFDVPSRVDNQEKWDVSNIEGILKWDISDILYNYWFIGKYMNVGGEMGDDRGQINILNPQSITCLEVYKSLNQFFSIESNTVDYQLVLEDFIDGKYVFTFVTTDAIARLEEAVASGECVFSYGFANMPAVNDELQSRAMSVTEVIAINGYSSHKEQANLFASFLATEYASHLYELSGKVPANVNIEHENEALSVYLSEYEKSIPLPKLMETSNYWLRLELLFSKVWNGGDVPTLVQELSDQMHLQFQESVMKNIEK